MYSLLLLLLYCTFHVPKCKIKTHNIELELGYQVCTCASPMALLGVSVYFRDKMCYTK